LTTGRPDVHGSSATRWLTVILLVALFIRIVAVIGTPHYVPRADASDFVRHGASIAAGDGYPPTLLATGAGGPTAFRPPAYPYFLGGVFAISGNSLTAGRIADALLSTLDVLLIYLLARAMWDIRVGLVAAGIAALYVPFAIWPTALLTEPLFTTFVLAAVLAALGARQGDRLAWAVLAGVFCALAALTRSNGVLIAIPLALGVWTLAPRWSRRALATPVVLLASTALVMAPWAVRNTVELHRFVPISTQGGYSLAGAYNPFAQAIGRWVGPQFQGPYVRLFHRPDLNEAELDAELRRRALDYARAHPGYVLELSGRGILRMLGLEATNTEVSFKSGGSPIGPLTVALADAANLILLAAAIVGGVLLVTGRGPPRAPAFVWAIPVLLVLPAIPILGGIRYRAPADPFLVLLAAVAVTWAWSRLSLARDHRPAQSPAS
jgi:4-amino-4-deoxy-L-arabinose transferase-like glycosyltransferase